MTAAPAPVSTRSWCAVGMAPSGTTGPPAPSSCGLRRRDPGRGARNGQGLEIILGAASTAAWAPVRSERTEVWGQRRRRTLYPDGQGLRTGTCLYFKVLDAGEALTRHQEIGLVQARDVQRSGHQPQPGAVRSASGRGGRTTQLQPLPAGVGRCPCRRARRSG